MSLKTTVAAFALILVPFAAHALEPGCYRRAYSGEHLARHPDQVVQIIKLRIGDWVTNVSRDASVLVMGAGQGHSRDLSKVVMSQQLFCGTESNSQLCRAECDAGSLVVTKQSGDTLLFKTRYLLVDEDANDGCGGTMDLAEQPDTWVTYKLFRVGPESCEGM